MNLRRSALLLFVVTLLGCASTTTITTEPDATIYDANTNVALGKGSAMYTDSKPVWGKTTFRVERPNCPPQTFRISRSDQLSTGRMIAGCLLLYPLLLWSGDYKAAYEVPPAPCDNPDQQYAAAPSATKPAPVAATPGEWPELDTQMTPMGGGENDAAVVVGIEDYAFVADIPGAARNAKDWYRYFTHVRKTRPANVKLLLNTDATDDGIRAAVADASKRVGKGGTLWFVFVGHGAPAENQKDGLVVGVDAQQNARGLFGRSVPQNELLKLAAAGKPSRTVFVVDACFSGRSSTGEALAQGLQPLLAVDVKVPDPTALVFSAGRADEFAGPLPHGNRPAFSYLMLGGLLGWSDANADGLIDSRELIGYSRETLRAVLNDRNQTPELNPDKSEALTKSAGAQAPDVGAIVLQNK